MTRFCYVIGPVTAVFLSASPVGEFVVWLWLLIAAQIAVVIMLARDFRQHAATSSVIVVDREEQAIRLLRRVVPHLRSRRPQSVVEAQLRWRRAAEAHRRWRLAS